MKNKKLEQEGHFPENVNNTLRFACDHVHSEQEKSRFSLLMELDVLMPAGDNQAELQ